MAGDIGNPRTQIYELFLRKISKIFKEKKIILIAGNHEYYDLKSKNCYDGDWIEDTEIHIREIISHFPNIIFLQNEVYCIPNTNLCIYGSTFWTRILEEEEEEIKLTMNDYFKIPDFTIDKCRRLHNKAHETLKNSLKVHSNKSFIVVTHHLPSFKLIDPKYVLKKINSAYATEIDDRLIQNSKILKWFAGHTHTPCEYDKFHVNPIGYPDENYMHDFNKLVCLT